MSDLRPINFWQWTLVLMGLFGGLDSLAQTRFCQVLGLRDGGSVPLAGAMVTLRYKDPDLDTTLLTDGQGKFWYPAKYIKQLDSVLLTKKSYRPEREKARPLVSVLYMTSSRLFRGSYEQRADRLNRIEQQLAVKRGGRDCYTPLLNRCRHLRQLLVGGQDSLQTEGLTWQDHVQLRRQLDEELALIQMGIDLVDEQVRRPVGKRLFEGMKATVLSRTRLGLSFCVSANQDCSERRYPVRVSVFTEEKRMRVYMADSLSHESDRQYWLLPGTTDTTLMFRVNPKRSVAFHRKRKYTVVATTLNRIDTLGQVQTDAVEEQPRVTRLNRQTPPRTERVGLSQATNTVVSAGLGRSIRVADKVRLVDEGGWLHLRFTAFGPTNAQQKAPPPWVRLYIYAGEKTDTLYAQPYRDGADIPLSSVLLNKSPTQIITFQPDSLAPVQTVEITIRNKRNKILLHRPLGLESTGATEGILFYFTSKPMFTH